MALNIKNDEVEALVAEVASLTGESKTEAVRRALLERKERLGLRTGGRSRSDRLREFLEQEVWPLIPEDRRGRRLKKEEKEAILGYGPDGV